eukprot:6196780-Pleurochrysis_carterae.AAC.2
MVLVPRVMQAVLVASQTGFSQAQSFGSTLGSVDTFIVENQPAVDCLNLADLDSAAGTCIQHTVTVTEAVVVQCPQATDCSPAKQCTGFCASQNACHGVNRRYPNGQRMKKH